MNETSARGYSAFFHVVITELLNFVDFVPRGATLDWFIPTTVTMGPYSRPES